MRFWSGVHFKDRKKLICISVNKNYNCQVRTVTFSLVFYYFELTETNKWIELVS